MLVAHEALLDGGGEEAFDAVVVALHVQQRARLSVQAELGPGVDLEQLLERAEPAGKSDEGVRQLRHQRLALVHRAHDAHVRDLRVGDLPVHERARDHAGDLAALGEHRVGERAHQAHAAAAVHHPDSVGHEQPRELGGGLRVLRPGAGAGSTEDADSPHREEASL